MTNLNDEGISGLYPNLGGLDGDQKFGYPLLPELRLDKGKDVVFENQYGRNNEDTGKFLYNSFNQGGYEGILGGSIGFKGYEIAGFGTSKDKYCKSVRLSEDDDELLCCITNETMTDPVITPYGHCFEKSAIEEWLGKNNTCPITSKPLETSQLFPCYALKKIIDRLE